MDNVPNDAPKSPPAGDRETNVTFTPQQSYDSMLSRYIEKLQAIRQLTPSNLQVKGDPEVIGRHDKTYRLQEQMHDIHRRMLQVGESLGKDKDQVFWDILLTEGNLKELEVRDMPIIRLPMVRKTSLGSNEEETPQSQSLISPDGTVIASLNRPPARSGEDLDKITYTGDKAAFDKWQGHPYFALIFASEQWTNYMFVERQYCEGYTKRMQRMRTLAQDLHLNLFDTNDGLGHQDYGSLTLHGVEISGERIAEVARAIKNDPGKYWLTDEELDHPTSVESLSQESDDVLRDGIYALGIKLSVPFETGNTPDQKIAAAYANYVAVARQRGLEVRSPLEDARREEEAKPPLVRKIRAISRLQNRYKFDPPTPILPHSQYIEREWAYAYNTFNDAFLPKRPRGADRVDRDIAEQRKEEVFTLVANLHPIREELENITNEEELNTFFGRESVVHDIRLSDFLLDENIRVVLMRLPKETFQEFMRRAQKGELPACFTSDQERERLQQTYSLGEVRTGTARQLFYDLSIENPAESRSLKDDFSLDNILNSVREHYPQ